MNIGEELPPIFHHGNCCLLRGYFFRQENTPTRTVGTTYHFAKLSPVQEKVLYLRLDDGNDEVHGFVERAKQVKLHVPRRLQGPAQPRAGWAVNGSREAAWSKHVTGHRNALSSPAPPLDNIDYARVLNPIEPAIMVSIHVIKARHEKTILVVDERWTSDRPLAVIGEAIYWNLEGIEVRGAVVV